MDIAPSSHSLIGNVKQSHPLQSTKFGDSQNDDDEKEKPQSEWNFYREVSLDSLEISSSLIILEIVWNMGLMFAGTLGNLEYTTAISLSDTILYFCCLVIVWGVNEGFTSIASRAYASGHHKLVASYLQKGILIQLFFYVIMVFVAFRTRQILLWLGQPESISNITQEYLISILPMILFEVLYDLLRSFLNSIEIYNVSTIISLVTLVIHPITCYALLDLGLYGISLANNITSGLKILSIVVYIYFINPCPEALQFKLSFFYKGFIEFGRNVFSIGLPILFEACYFGIMSIAAMELKDPIMFSAHIFIMTIFEIFSCIFLGINLSLNTLAANAVGERDELKCRRIVKFAYLSTFVLAITVLGPMYFLQDKIFRIITQDEQVLSTMHELFMIIISYTIFDYMQVSLQGILKGIGNGDESFWITTFGLWICGFPLIFFLGFYMNLKIYGIWIAYGISVLIQFICSFIALNRIDWPSLIIEKVEQLELEEDKLEKDQIKFLEKLS